MADVYYIPSGPKNLAPLFPAVDWNKVDDYYIEIMASSTIVGTTPIINVNCCCPDKGVRIHFLNYLGAYDAINFNKPAVVHETTFDTYQQPLAYPLQKTDTGSERFNLRSNDTYECFTKCYKESDMPWIQELLDCAKAYIEWSGIEGQSDDYLPIIITSTQFDKLKNEIEYFYKVTIQFKLANDFFIQRN